MSQYCDMSRVCDNKSVPLQQILQRGASGSLLPAVPTSRDKKTYSGAEPDPRRFAGRFHMLRRRKRDAVGINIAT
jgi:hypothetical protein